jgi:hypothetical protein
MVSERNINCVAVVDNYHIAGPTISMNMSQNY